MNILQFYRYSILERPGGTYRYIDDLSRALAAQGHQVCFVSTTRNNLQGSARVECAPGYSIYNLRVSQSRLGRQWDYLAQLPALMYELDDQIGFDAVVIHDPYFPLRFTTRKMRKRPILTRFFYISSFYEAAYNAKRLRSLLPPARRLLDWAEKLFSLQIQRIVEHRNLVQADRIVVLSEYTRRMLVSFHGKSMLGKIVLIPGGVDVERFSRCDDANRVRSRLGLPTGSTLLFTIRNLSPRMGLENLVRAMRLVRDALPDRDVQLYIGGRGALREVLEQMVGNLHLDRKVHLLGYVSEEELPLYYQACDFFVLPTAALEGFGMVTLEALATNTPVIGTPAGATFELLSQFSPNLTTEGTRAEDLARKIVECVTNQDVILSQWDSQRLIKAKYNWANVAKQVAEAIRRDCHSGGP